MSRMNTLMVSISGVRGIVGQSFTPAVVQRYVSAFCELVEHNNKAPYSIVLGQDSRVSGSWVVLLVQSIMQAKGFEVLNCGIVPTPTVQYLVIDENASAGLVVTASHNPEMWNGLKFIDHEGLFLGPSDFAELMKIATLPEYYSWASNSDLGLVTQLEDPIIRHVDELLELEECEPSVVQEKNFKVVLDTVNGAGGPIMKYLLECLGCEVITLNYKTTGIFAHSPEPIPENLNQLCEAVLENEADFGIATDPDVDRCVFIDEKGSPIGEEYTLGIAVYYWVSMCENAGPICKNLSSSRVVDDIARDFGCEVYNTPVGEIHVATKMAEVKAIIGGEGNGGVMLPDLHIGRDAPVAATLVLQALAKQGGTLSALKESLPQYKIVKVKVDISSIGRIGPVLDKIRQEWFQKGADITDIDGLKIDTENWWVHLRKSNTEPVIRVIAEAETEEEATHLCNIFTNALKPHKKLRKKKSWVIPSGLSSRSLAFNKDA
eukprot:TRINITY_DN5616_c0_g1_i1.p1 TRINITY_DN5616_c0_g1~~TRINITY_DN5616_c0_g1_i1.p1  ORF type:complete len:498 (-),score=127.88 TRINITY_DN5616_c0_g1_i1:29-1498(-)